MISTIKINIDRLSMLETHYFNLLFLSTKKFIILDNLYQGSLELLSD